MILWRFSFFCRHMRGQPLRIADRNRRAPVSFPLQTAALQLPLDFLPVPSIKRLFVPDPKTFQKAPHVKVSVLCKP
jgi:hypothetical protein